MLYALLATSSPEVSLSLMGEGVRCIIQALVSASFIRSGTNILTARPIDTRRVPRMIHSRFQKLVLAAFGALLLSVTASSAYISQLPATQQLFLDRFVAAAIERTHHIVRYDSSYVRIPYPGGDVPAGTGVCTDEVIRAYRAVGIDLQKEVHEDMANHLSAYPRKWNRSCGGANSATDSNIDHRRVPNLMVFFSRHGRELPLSADAKDYRPGDLVTWNLGGGITHIGI